MRDGFGDVIQRTSPDTGTTVYTYNAAGSPTQITDAGSVVTNLTYDDANRRVTKQYPASTGENITYTWDGTTSGNKGIGHLTEIDDASGSSKQTYDALRACDAKTTSGIGYTLGDSYDADGNVTTITYPSGRIVNYAEIRLGASQPVTTQQNSSSSAVTLAYSVTFEAFGPLQSLWYGNGLDIWKTFTQDYQISCLYLRYIC